MKKIVILLLSLCTISIASAQIGEKFTLGIRGGIGFGGFTSSHAYKLIGGTKSSNWNIENNSKITYNVGAIVDIPVYRKWGLSVQSGLWFTERHTKFEGTNTHSASTTRDLDVKAMYLQLPLQIGYHYNLKIVNLQALFGPFLEYRVGKGTNKADYSLSGGTHLEGDTFSDKDHALSYGLTFGFTAEYRHIVLGVKYDLGLTNYYDGSNSNRKTNEEIDLKGKMLSVILGWNF